ncbi:TPA: phage tail protein [Escherichia coli]
MFHVDNNSGVANMPALAPAQSNTTTWFTEGDGQKGISWIGQDWLNILQAELLNILAEASIQPDKAQLNQLTLSIKAIIAANAFSRKNNLKEIADAGAEAQRLARGYLGLGALATKNSLGPGDVNALAKDQNLADLENAGTARNNLDVYSKSEGDNRYLRREQNGADIPDKGAFIDNVGLGEGSALPVGVPVPWPSATPPTGWLKCNGAAFSAEEYPELAKAYPTNKLPDLRGEFIRGWDDGRGVDSSRGLLTSQDHLFASHGHWFDKYYALTGFDPTGGQFVVTADASGNLITANSISTVSVGGSETRPRNVAFNYIVRAA